MMAVSWLGVMYHWRSIATPGNSAGDNWTRCAATPSFYLQSHSHLQPSVFHAIALPFTLLNGEGNRSWMSIVWQKQQPQPVPPSLCPVQWRTKLKQYYDVLRLATAEAGRWLGTLVLSDSNKATEGRNWAWRKIDTRSDVELDSGDKSWYREWEHDSCEWRAIPARSN